jgi:hypothetical protein
MICCPENRLCFIFQLLSKGRIRAPSGLKRGGQINASEAAVI